MHKYIGDLLDGIRTLPTSNRGRRTIVRCFTWHSWLQYYTIILSSPSSIWGIKLFPCHAMPCRQLGVDNPHLQSTSILEDLLAVGLGLVGGRLRINVSIVSQSNTPLHNHITHLIAQSSLVTTKDAAVLAETSARGVITLLA